jgi:hypothetical protein
MAAAVDRSHKQSIAGFGRGCHGFFDIVSRGSGRQIVARLRRRVSFPTAIVLVSLAGPPSRCFPGSLSIITIHYSASHGPQSI